MTHTCKKILLVSNRLPVEIVEENNSWSVRSSPGGLVTALAPLMRRSHGTWIGWAGCSESAPAEKLISEIPDRGLNMIPVMLSPAQVEKYYHGFSNETIWPLFHDLLGHFSYNSENWQAYQEVNGIFAAITKKVSSEDSFIWVHDYQLLLVGHYLRNLGCNQYLSYFLHIPFPSPDMLRRLPFSKDVLRSLLSFDSVGFQTAQDKNNFISCIREYMPEAERFKDGTQTIINSEGRNTVVGNYPISIDFDDFNRGAKQKEVADSSKFLLENMKVEKIVLGIDRLDYTKGIPERFLAFEKFLSKYPEVRGRISLLQIVVPSRLIVTEYQNLKSKLDSLAGRINSAFSAHGWTPIHYAFRSLDRVQLLGHYRASHIAFITPLRDGMNLVSKEFCASSVDNKGVLILSDFAGSARQLGKAALLVNPYDAEASADALYRAFTMSIEEQTRRMKILRAKIRRHNVHKWINWFINDYELAKHSAEVAV